MRFRGQIKLVEPEDAPQRKEMAWDLRYEGHTKPEVWRRTLPSLFSKVSKFLRRSK